MPRLFLLFLITPIVELFLLIQLGQWIGLGPTLALIVVTALIGSSMARREGLNAWVRFQQATASGKLPGTEMIDGLIILVSGALLLTPGVLTDLFGFLGLIPASRAVMRRYLADRFKRSVEQGTVRVRFGGFRPGAGFQPGAGFPSGGEFQSDASSGSRTERQRPATGETGGGTRQQAQPGHYETSFGGRPKDRPSHLQE